MTGKKMISICLVSGLLTASLGASASSSAYAGERRGGDYRYGESRGGYGEKKAVPDVQEARRLLRENYSGRDVRIGDIREREWFFEADIRDRRGALVDKVIIDKRTGRIRSTY